MNVDFCDTYYITVKTIVVWPANYLMNKLKYFYIWMRKINRIV